MAKTLLLRNYLRVRGEYLRSAAWLMLRMELPPRARRIQDLAHDVAADKGTTSACAENTFKQTTPPPPRWNYLRVRGEYLMGEIRNQEDLELPPRARRIQTYGTPHDSYQGTTSACAENTLNELGLL